MLPRILQYAISFCAHVPRTIMYSISNQWHLYMYIYIYIHNMYRLCIIRGKCGNWQFVGVWTRFAGLRSQDAHNDNNTSNSRSHNNGNTIQSTSSSNSDANDNDNHDDNDHPITQTVASPQVTAVHARSPGASSSSARSGKMVPHGNWMVTIGRSPLL